MERLESLLFAAQTVEESGDLAAKIQWVEDVAACIQGLGKPGERAALDLKAALGAIVLYSKGKRTPEDRLAMEATVRTFSARGLYGLYGVLHDQYRELSLSGPHAKRARELAQIFLELQKSMGSGQKIPDGLRARMTKFREEDEVSAE